MGKITAYLERSNLMTPLFSTCLARKAPAFLEAAELHVIAETWEDTYYNWVCLYKSLRVETPNNPQRNGSSARQKWRVG